MLAMWKTILRLLCIAVALILAISYLTGPRYTDDIEDPNRMTAIIHEHLPPGTPIDDAQKFMESEGFKCSRSNNGRFLDREGIDYLYCDRHDGGNCDFVTRRWQIAIVHQNEKVVEIIAAKD
jgi:hypothetical protein